MAKFVLPYGRDYLTVSLPDEWQVEHLAPRKVPALRDPVGAVEQALKSPLGKRRLPDFAGARSAAIAISDATRPVPHKVLLPPLLRRLEALGLPAEAITLMVATGSHPPMASDAFASVVPKDILKRYPVLSHDADDFDKLVFLGVTSRSTPVWINEHFVRADLRVVVGNIEPHQFMGFSGGFKGAAIGLAGSQTISHNHTLMTDARARLGHFENNPTRQDVEEIGRLIGVQLALNAIVNEDKEIVEVMAGEPHEVMKRGIPLVRELCQVQASAPFDLVIAAPGGHPKDINLYQSQKALAHAALVTKEGGTIILVAACPEGTGSPSYERWMQDVASFDEVFQRFQREGFRLGPHKAYQIARDAARVRVLLVSHMSPELVRRLLLIPAEGLDGAMAVVRESLPTRTRVGVMPYANATIPIY